MEKSAGASSYNAIAHKRSGTKFDLSDIGHTIGGDWHILSNWDTRRATLSKGRIHIGIFKLLNKRDKELVKPQMLDRVNQVGKKSLAKTDGDNFGASGGAEGEADDGDDGDDREDDDNDKADSNEEQDEERAPVQAATPPARRAPAAKAESDGKRRRLLPPASGTGSAVSEGRVGTT